MIGLAELAAGSGEASKAGPIGLAVILALCVSCYFLFRSMSRHLRKVRRSFPTEVAVPQEERPKPPSERTEAPRGESGGPGPIDVEKPEQPPTR